MTLPDQPLSPAIRLGTALGDLANTIDARALEGAEDSYTARLLARGPRKCAQKLVEESGELAIAIAAETPTEVAAEAADLLYHMLVALRSRGVSTDAVADALIARQGVSGLAEKAARKP